MPPKPLQNWDPSWDLQEKRTQEPRHSSRALCATPFNICDTMVYRSTHPCWHNVYHAFELSCLQNLRHYLDVWIALREDKVGGCRGQVFAIRTKNTHYSTKSWHAFGNKNCAKGENYNRNEFIKSKILITATNTPYKMTSHHMRTFPTSFFFILW